MRRAVVLGGSVAGLLAARVLSDHARSVVIIEPDPLDTAPGPAGGPVPARPGVPQGVHLHVLLSQGRAQLERWFPGLTAELLAGGASLAPPVQYLDGRRKVAVAGSELLGATRPYLESVLLRRVLAIGHVTVVRGRADGLRFGPVGTGRQRGVTGAHYRPDGASARDCLGADLVVDATGRSTRLGVWLEQGGWPAPALHRMRIDLGYATGVFAGGDELPGVTALTAMARPAPAGLPQPDTAALGRVEGDRWMMVLAGYADRRPGADVADFRARCRAVDAAPVRQVADRELLGPLRLHRIPDSRRRDFLGAGRFPAGLVAAGDAVAAFNPVYGQGMTSAALHASCLAAHLRSGAPLDRPARGYFERIRVVVDAAWGLSTLGDLAQPHVDGPYPRGYRAAAWYGDLVNRLATTDPEVGRRFLQVVTMERHPRLLTRPGTLAQVARAAWSARTARG
ncbi:hypothetical protein POF50_020025 [Streptomyces sp. SL13]|uniref:FAD-dependent oxidoreductase n=1 Tax=Streptantibioticus silvisoli TaxID=2705255 RepID=A0AA90JYV5_9ACTN|nr:hypothetical protein [Streptantibioticus silvisoli]MDI5971591.1 hypothetical protein [Streptantibioticus silvisoli]